MPDSTSMDLVQYSALNGLLVGRLVRVDITGFYVDYPGNNRGGVRAMTTLTKLPIIESVDVPVLLAFADNLPDVPIVLGVVSERFLTETNRLQPSGGTSAPTAEPPSRVLLRARETIEISCGESSIVLQSDGTVIIRGRRLTSRAKEGNKIKGGFVSIN